MTTVILHRIVSILAVCLNDLLILLINLNRYLLAKGHNRSALALWNNMLEPVGEKLWEWHPEEQFQCPTAERPYFATSKNSVKFSKK